MTADVYFVDDDEKAGELFLRFSKDASFAASVFRNADDAIAAFTECPASVVVTDLSMPGRDGLQLMQELLRMAPDLAVIMITGFATVDNAIEAMKLGAEDFIRKPYDMEELVLLVERCLDNVRIRQENRLLKRQLDREREYLGMIGKSPALKAIQGIIEKITDVRCHVIIEGESGTGKELVARAIHEQSLDADKPFVVIDCGAMTESLLESELFGHEKGAFTGAAHSKQGLLEQASGGTVFLDEICNISDAMQVKLLRVVQENQVTRVGGLKPVEIDLRFVAATNRNLEQMMADGLFREDLYHRLHVIKIRMPALRERKDDIPMLVENFIRQFSDRYHRDVQAFNSQSMQLFMSYHWPGNIRELKNIVERHVALAEPGKPMSVDESAICDPPADSVTAMPAGLHGWPDLKTLEQNYIQAVLDHVGGNRERAAQLLGINKSTLWRKLKPTSR